MKALRSEKPVNQDVVMINAFLRPTRSENQPPDVAPKNIPKDVAEMMKLTVEMAKFQDFMIPGAAYPKAFTPPARRKIRSKGATSFAGETMLWGDDQDVPLRMLDPACIVSTNLPQPANASLRRNGSGSDL